MPKIEPIRLRRSRAKGSRLVSPNGLPICCVTRPGKFGNPYKTAAFFECILRAHIGNPIWIDSKDKIGRVKWIADNIEQLRGKNLACWCSLKAGVQCHADVLLKILAETEHAD